MTWTYFELKYVSLLLCQFSNKTLAGFSTERGEVRETGIGKGLNISLSQLDRNETKKAHAE